MGDRAGGIFLLLFGAAMVVTGVIQVTGDGGSSGAWFWTPIGVLGIAYGFLLIRTRR